MINIGFDRKKYSLKPTVPSGTDSITYNVHVAGVLDGTTNISMVQVFRGSCRYFGGEFEVDATDWIDSFLYKYTWSDVGGTWGVHTVTSCTVSASISFYDSAGSIISAILKHVTWTPATLNKAYPTFGNVCGEAKLLLYNSGYVHNDQSTKELCVPLWTLGGVLQGKTVNNLQKVTYMDRYGDMHNGSIGNKYELECYVDPDWLNVHQNPFNYEVVMACLQASLKTYLNSVNSLTIPGMGTSSSLSLEGRVKDMEKVEVQSNYTTDQKVPTLKIVFEVYR